MPNYLNSQENEWRAITDNLVQAHPLSLDFIRQTVLVSWETLWSFSSNSDDFAMNVSELGLTAQAVSSFFEKILIKRITQMLPGVWRGGKATEKDLHNLEDESLSFELKMSGQSGFKVFGNRSYGFGADEKNGAKSKKSKSGYYLIINYSGRHITLIRFGWIDGQDWQAQKSQSGQMASLKQYVYDHKLVTIDGSYRLQTPVDLIHGVGNKAARDLNQLGIFTIHDLLGADLSTGQFSKHQASAHAEYGHLLG